MDLELQQLADKFRRHNHDDIETDAVKAEHIDGLTEFINDTVTPVIPFNIFSQMVDLVHWNSLDGFIGSGSGNATARDSTLLLQTPSGAAGTGYFIYSTEPYYKIYETGKTLSIEWQIANATTFTNGVNVYFYLTAGTSTPPTTQEHFGFTISDGTLYSSNADGTTRATATLSTSIVAGPQRTRLRVEAIKGASIKYYVNDVLKHTETLNLPTATDLYLNMGITTPNTTPQTVNINRVLINKAY